MKEEPRTAVKHDFEHETPTVMHHPEEDLTILAKWLRRGMEKGPRFWFLVAGVIAVVTLLTVLANGLSSGRSLTAKGWSELALAQTPGQKIEIAEEFPNSDVSRVARLQAATNFFTDAVRGLPADRETAGPQLKKALDLFQQVAKEAPKDDPEALAAAFGAARTLEARNELPEAIAQYKTVAAGWPGTPEAKQAEKLATQLQDPEVIAFYKELYAYKPPSVPSPSSGSSILTPSLGGVPAGHPSLNSPTLPADPLPTIPALPFLPDSDDKAKPSSPGPLDIAPPPNLVEPVNPTGKDAIPQKLGSREPDSPAPAKPADITQPTVPTPKTTSTPILTKPEAPSAKPELPNDPFTPATKP